MKSRRELLEIIKTGGTPGKREWPLFWKKAADSNYVTEQTASDTPGNQITLTSDQFEKLNKTQTCYL